MSFEHNKASCAFVPDSSFVLKGRVSMQARRFVVLFVVQVMMLCMRQFLFEATLTCLSVNSHRHQLSLTAALVCMIVHL